jgi:hypothetical protein
MESPTKDKMTLKNWLDLLLTIIAVIAIISVLRDCNLPEPYPGPP